MTRMINRYSPILKPEICLLLPIPIAPPRKSILPVQVPIPAPRTSLESYKQSETAHSSRNERQKDNEEKNNAVGSKSKTIIPWESPSHCIMVIFLVLMGVVITIFVPGIKLSQLLIEAIIYGKYKI